MEQKPIILEIEEAKQELIQCVNDMMAKHRLPCYLMEPMFADVYGQIKASARNELEQARAQVAMAQAQDGAE
mgnify:CR=1 FL=1